MTEDLVPLEFTAQQYQDARMESVPALYKTTHERLACELALRMEDPEAIFARYRYTPEAALQLIETPGFAALLDRIGREIRESGLSFKTKAKAQAEELLGHSYEIATDPQASTAVRADLIKWTAKMAGYEPREKDDAKGVSGGLNLSITFAGQAPVKIVQQEPVTINQEAS